MEHLKNMLFGPSSNNNVPQEEPSLWASSEFDLETQGAAQIFAGVSHRGGYKPPRNISAVLSSKTMSLKREIPDTEKKVTLTEHAGTGILFIDQVEEEIDESITEPYMPSYLKYAVDFVNPIIQKEPILSTTSERYTVYPIEYPTVWTNYKTQLN